MKISGKFAASIHTRIFLQDDRSADGQIFDDYWHLFHLLLLQFRQRFPHHHCVASERIQRPSIDYVMQQEFILIFFRFCVEWINSVANAGRRTAIQTHRLLFGDDWPILRVIPFDNRTQHGGPSGNRPFLWRTVQVLELYGGPRFVQFSHVFVEVDEIVGLF